VLSPPVFDNLTSQSFTLPMARSMLLALFLALISYVLATPVNSTDSSLEKRITHYGDVCPISSLRRIKLIGYSRPPGFIPVLGTVATQISKTIPSLPFHRASTRKKTIAIGYDISPRKLYLIAYTNTSGFASSIRPMGSKPMVKSETAARLAIGNRLVRISSFVHLSHSCKIT
jgi:hypothetical protein